MNFMIKFCSKADEAKIRVVLIMAQYKNKWIFCKNNTRYECPGGHVEKNEYYYNAACRELEEETGAIVYDISFLSFFSLVGTKEFGQEEIFGAYYFANVYELGSLLYEIKEIEFFNKLPLELNYPQTQIALINEYYKIIEEKR